MADDTSALLAALAKIDVLRHAAANAAPAIEELLRVGCNRTLLLWEWMGSAMAPAAPAQRLPR
jgi:hypothetical protein